MNNDDTQWKVVVLPGRPITILPVDVDVTGWINTSKVSDTYATYLNPENGQVIDCTEFAKQMGWET